MPNDKSAEPGLAQPPYREIKPRCSGSRQDGACQIKKTRRFTGYSFQKMNNIYGDCDVGGSSIFEERLSAISKLFSWSVVDIPISTNATIANKRTRVRNQSMPAMVHDNRGEGETLITRGIQTTATKRLMT